jgi:hypothetical protein
VRRALGVVGNLAAVRLRPPGSRPWLPQPAEWAALSFPAQCDDQTSSLQLYRAALSLRRSCPQLGDGERGWWSTPDDEVVILERPGDRSSIVCAVNLGQRPAPTPEGDLLIASTPLVDCPLPPDEAGWWSVSAWSGAPAASSPAAGSAVSPTETRGDNGATGHLGIEAAHGRSNQRRPASSSVRSTSRLV